MDFTEAKTVFAEAKTEAAVHEGRGLGTRATCPSSSASPGPEADAMEYGSLGFNVVAAVIKIAFMIMGFLMPRGVDPHLAGAAAVVDDAGSPRSQPRQHPAALALARQAGELAHVGHHPLHGRRAQVHGQGGLRPRQGPQVPLHVGADHGDGAGADRRGHHPVRRAALLGRDVRQVGLDGACSQPVGLQIARLDIGLLFYFAISSLAVYGATLAGWASHNKWAMMGGLRATSQMMSYEVTMGMAVLGAFLVYGTLEPGAIADLQTHFLSFGHYASSWGIFTQPVGFVLFLTAAIAETKRTPFDIPEGEPEIIGYFVEYSGLRFGIFFLGEFLEIVTSSAIMITRLLRRLALGRTHRRIPPGPRTCRTSHLRGW